jgi:peptidoglycan/xylan/chitin deacetylase (PgdA/CDA1 family)
MRVPHERFEFSPIRDRQPWKLPGGARIAVWTIVNVEDWDIEQPVPRQVIPAPAGAAVLPDVPNWAWHDYGMRVGFWRLLEALARRRIPATAAINARVCTTYPPVARAMLEAGWEFMGHGFVQGAMHQLADQRAAIRQSVDALRAFTGRPPRGWLGPGLTETWETLDLLQAEGVRYVCDWVNDDQPYLLRTAGGPLVSVPYTMEVNDLPMMVVQHHAAPELFRRATDQFDRLWAEGARQPRVMAIAVHPYISGVPHRIKYLEAVYDYVKRKRGVWLTTGEQICEWYRTQAGLSSAPGPGPARSGSTAARTGGAAR